jgi:hypothetical protein
METEANRVSLMKLEAVRRSDDSHECFRIAVASSIHGVQKAMANLSCGLAASRISTNLPKMASGLGRIFLERSVDRCNCSEVFHFVSHKVSKRHESFEGYDLRECV